MASSVAMQLGSMHVLFGGNGVAQKHSDYNKNVRLPLRPNVFKLNRMFSFAEFEKLSFVRVERNYKICFSFVENQNLISVKRKCSI